MTINDLYVLVSARLQMQNLIDGPVYLELFVKVVNVWLTSGGTYGATFDGEPRNFYG